MTPDFETRAKIIADLVRSGRVVTLLDLTAATDWSYHTVIRDIRKMRKLGVLSPVERYERDGQRRNFAPQKLTLREGS